MNFVLLWRRGLKVDAGDQTQADGKEQAALLRSIPGVVVHRVSPYSATVFFPGDKEQLEGLLTGTKWMTVHIFEQRKYRLQ
ncbi:hypothetical protein [Burkholderia gladioli]|uniref:hypothetical protein n=1 Tax=Burkholderia gladioli TaxID=28095 RepID=UPI00163E4CEE|nr:hypothetical protein [Burkholderia gladioli]